MQICRWGRGQARQRAPPLSRGEFKNWVIVTLRLDGVFFGVFSRLSGREPAGARAEALSPFFTANLMSLSCFLETGLEAVKREPSLPANFRSKLC